MSYIDSNPAARDRFNLLSIDAWREADGGWFWNSWSNAGENMDLGEIILRPTDAPDDRRHARRVHTRRLLSYLRGVGKLSATSRGLCAVEWDSDDTNAAVIINRRTGEPLYAFAYDSDATDAARNGTEYEPTPY